MDNVAKNLKYIHLNDLDEENEKIRKKNLMKMYSMILHIILKFKIILMMKKKTNTSRYMKKVRHISCTKIKKMKPKTKFIV